MSLLKALNYDAMALGNNDFSVTMPGNAHQSADMNHLKDYHLT
ncbi:hypothetical protein ACQKNS_02200 [Peribacillus sp. NPDC094092]